jgi:hypothetical protein
VKERRLVSVRRVVLERDLDRYRTVWQELEQAVIAAGAHAWRFVSAADPSRFLEFIEFARGSDPRDLPAAAHALAELERLASGSAEEWDESRP